MKERCNEMKRDVDLSVVPIEKIESLMGNGNPHWSKMFWNNGSPPPKKKTIRLLSHIPKEACRSTEIESRQSILMLQGITGTDIPSQTVS